MIAGNSLFPYFLLGPDANLPEITDVMAPAEHRSLDLGTTREAVDLAGVIKHLERVEECGGHAVVMNHPDIHYRQLRSVIRYLANRDVWAASLSEVTAFIKERRKYFLAVYEAIPLPREIKRTPCHFAGSTKFLPSINISSDGKSSLESKLNSRWSV